MSTNPAMLPPGFTILALETSCDETAAAVVRDGQIIQSNVVASQMDLLQRYGGVVPEAASRQHIRTIIPVVETAVQAIPGGWNDIHAIAVTSGPGLGVALLTGLNTAKAIALRRGLPLVGVNHLEAHMYANWLVPDTFPNGSLPAGLHAPADDLEFPLVALVVSGGHSLVALLHGHGNYELLGQTRDDAAGEAFDKVARLLGLGFPGGPAIQAIAEGVRFKDPLPRAWLRDSFDFSFSGLKTAVLHKVEALRPNDGTPIPERTVAQLAAAFQDSVVDVLVTKATEAARQHRANGILLAGGVAANAHLRSEFERRSPLPVRFPPLWLCTDNAAMIAAAAYFRYQPDDTLALDIHSSLPFGAVVPS